MMKFIKPVAITLALVIMLSWVGIFAAATRVEAADETTTQVTADADTQTITAADATSGKAYAAALAIAIPAIGGAIGMAIAIAKSNDGIARQPEASDKIRTLLMLGLVFIETVVIYALIVAILIIFVM